MNKESMLDTNSDMYLRITSEIAIKLLIVGGLSKVYEIGNYFRNGSVNEMHSAPFMALEAYHTNETYDITQKIAEKILFEITNGSKKILKEYGRDVVIDFTMSIPECTFEEYIRSFGYETFCIDNPDTYPDVPELKEKSNDIIPNSKALYKWFKNSLIKTQISPMWISDLPSGQSPFIKKIDSYRLCRKYLVVNGATLVEVTQGETDPLVIEKNLDEQQRFQPNKYPHDYEPLLHAYKMGIPPICSMFMSVDRMYQALVNDNNINEYKMYI